MRQVKTIGTVAVIALASLLMATTAYADVRRPNVVFFLVDDLGWRDLGCYGSSFYETPNVDQFAKRSVRFTLAYATCHVCSPTRASIMTGKYPARLHLTDWLSGRREFPFQQLFEHNVPAFENVANVEKLPTAGATVVALPMKIGAGSGAPLRIIAMVRE